MKTPPTTQVPKQYYGYSLQCTECVARLLEAEPGGVVSLEVFEDVGLQSADGQILATQTKAGGGANPVSDSSVDLWKTFRNWIDQVNSKKINKNKCQFELYVNSNQKGKLCTEMTMAASPAEAQLIINRIKEKFLGKRTGKIKPSVAKELTKQLDVILKPENEQVLLDIIVRFRHRGGSGRAYEDLAVKLEKTLVDKDVIQDVLLRGLAWVRKVVDERIEQDLPAIVPVDAFRAELTTYRNKLKSRPYLENFAGTASPEEIELNKLARYVRQLQYIDADEDEIYEAITDYLNAKANAVQYAVRNLINRTSLDDLSNNLKTTWKNIRKKLQLEADSKSDIHFGQRLANACLSHRATLEGLEVPYSFTPDCFHDLADAPEIGWHPKYEQMLKEDEK